MNVVDCAFAPLSGITAQPTLNGLVEAMRYTERDTGPEVRRRCRRRRSTGRTCEPTTPRSSRGRTPRPPTCTCTRCPAARRPTSDAAVANRWASATAGRGLPHVRRGEPPVRRHRQGDADLEGRRRHDAVHDVEQPDRRGRGEPEARDRLPRVGDGVLRGQAGPAPRRLPEGSAGTHPSRPPAADRPPRRDATARRLRRCRQGTRTEAEAHADRPRGRVVPAVPEGVRRLRRNTRPSTPT